MKRIAYFKGYPVGALTINLVFDPPLEDVASVCNSHVSFSFNPFLGTTSVYPFLELLTMKFKITFPFISVFCEKSILNLVRSIIYCTFFPKVFGVRGKWLIR